MMINGVLAMVRNVSELEYIPFTDTPNIVYVGEQDMMFPFPIIKAPILLPPIDAVMAESNGDMQSYYNIYTWHLANNEVAASTITTILVSLYYGKNIALLIEAPELSHFDTLFNMFRSVYGIIPATSSNPFSMGEANPITEARIAAEMYCYMDGYDAYISPFEFASTIVDTNVYQFLVQEEISGGNKSLSKLAYEIGFLKEPIFLPEFNSFFNYLMEFKSDCNIYGNIVQNQNKGQMIKILGDEVK